MTDAEPFSIVLDFPPNCALFIDLGVRAGNNIVAMADQLNGFADTPHAAQAFTCGLTVEAVMTGIELMRQQTGMGEDDARHMACARLLDLAARLQTAAASLTAGKAN